MKIITGLSTEQNRGPCIDKIEHIDDMLLYALGISRAKAVEPFFDKADRTTEKGCKLALRPVRMLLNEAAKIGALGNPLSFHEGDLLKNGRNNQTMTMDPTSTWSIRTALWRA